MRRFTWLLLLAVGCRTMARGTPATGAASPRVAIDRFIAAANAQDVQALLGAWGDEKGARLDRSSTLAERTQDERSAIILICHLRNSTYKIGDSTPVAGERTVFDVDMNQGTAHATVRFTVASTPAHRYFVEDFDLVTMQHAGFCSNSNKKP